MLAQLRAIVVSSAITSQQQATIMMVCAAWLPSCSVVGGRPVQNPLPKRKLCLAGVLQRQMGLFEKFLQLASYSSYR